METPPTLLAAIRQAFAALPIGLRIYFFVVLIAELWMTFFVNTGRALATQTVLNLAWFPFIYGHLSLSKYLQRREIAHLIDPDAATEQDLVRIRLVHNRVTFAEDAGTLMFSDGMLVFNGLRTSFAVSSAYMCLDPDMKIVVDKEAGRVPEGIPIRYEVGGQLYYAIVSFVPRSHGGGPSKRGFWNAQTVAWATDKTPSNKLVVLPPITPSPQSYRLGLRLRLSALGLFPIWLICVVLPCTSELIHEKRDLFSVYLPVGFLVVVLGCFVWLFNEARKTDRKVAEMRELP